MVCWYFLVNKQNADVIECSRRASFIAIIPIHCTAKFVCTSYTVCKRFGIQPISMFGDDKQAI